MQIISRRTAQLAGETNAMTLAQRACVDATLATDPLIRAHPEITRELAAAEGFPVSEPSPGLATLVMRAR